MLNLYNDSVGNANHHVPAGGNGPHFLAEFVGAGGFNDGGLSVMDPDEGRSDRPLNPDCPVLVQGIKSEGASVDRDPYIFRSWFQEVEGEKTQRGEKDEEAEDYHIPPGDG